MTTHLTSWYTEAEAALYLKVPEEALKLARYRKKVKAGKFCGVVQYKQEWLDDFREASCEARQRSANEQDHHFGTSRFRREGDQSELAQARAMVLKLNASSRNSSSNAKHPKSPNTTR